MPPLRTHEDDAGNHRVAPSQGAAPETFPAFPEPVPAPAPAPDQVAAVAGTPATPIPAPAPAPPPDRPSGDGAGLRGLTADQRERISAELARQQIGDAIERRLFLAALDYQVTALATRLPASPGANGAAPTPALLAAACADAAGTLEARIATEAERVCQGFVGELAGAFDACFETPPTPEPQGPFMRILALLREVLGLPLTLDTDRLRQVISGPLAQSPRS